MYQKYICLLLLSYSVASVFCKAQTRVQCSLKDATCTTTVGESVYKKLIDGIPNMGIPTLEPNHVDVINGYSRDFNYTLTDANLHGMTNCTTPDLKIFPEHLNWTFALHCPRLVMQANYECTGRIGEIQVEGKGLAQTTDVDNHMIIQGTIDYYKGDDKKSHMKVISYDIKQIEILGNVKYELHNLHYGDELKSKKTHEYINKNWKAVSSVTHYPALSAFIGKMYENLNIYLSVVPADEVFSTNI